jgi:hypothetical protein
MKLEVYCENANETKEKPMPLLAVKQGYRDINVLLVTECGEFIAYLFSQYGACECAKEALEKKEYRTDWAEWDEGGRFVGLAQ